MDIILEKRKKLYTSLWYALFFLTPFVFSPQTSEIFEFNKMIFVYLLTTSITFLWVIEMIYQDKFIFKKTYLDIPLLLFLFSQIFSTYYSIDTRTSLLGYYGRFHGGLISTVSYLLLYWAFVSTIRTDEAKKALKLLVLSGSIVSIIALFEKYGISLTCLLATDSLSSVNFSCWNQDFQSRVFATLGQPNWLAAWITALSPLVFAINYKVKKLNTFLPYTLYAFFFVIVLFTKSRSGLVAFLLSFLLHTSFVLYHWLKLLFQKNKKPKSIFGYLKHDGFTKLFILACITTTIIFFSTSSSVPSYFSKLWGRNTSIENNTVVITDTLTIRKIVWKGALGIWKENIIFGTGVETFALSFPLHRPVELNTTSEWDFLFNKAHNEYLNILATTGIVGLGAYLIFIVSTLYIFLKYLFLINKKQTSDNTYHLQPALSLFIGWISILITNFFGFSVVSIGILFYLFPALFVITTNIDKSEKTDKTKALNQSQKLKMAFIFFTFLHMLLSIGTYWQSDYFFAHALQQERSGQLNIAKQTLDKVISLQASEALFLNKRATITATLAANAAEKSDTTLAKKLEQEARDDIEKATKLSPHDPHTLKSRAIVFNTLSSVTYEAIYEARTELLTLTNKYPTDPKIKYNAATLLIRTGETETGIEELRKTIALKPNYKDPRLALATLLFDAGENDKALNELLFIQKNIDPFDERVNDLLDKIEANKETNNF